MESVAEKQVLSALEAIAEEMLTSRATRLEVLAYLAFLCYAGMRGGVVTTEEGTPLDDAMETICSLRRFTSEGGKVIPDLEDKVFLHASYGEDAYIKAFHQHLQDISQDFLNQDDWINCNPHLYKWALSNALLGDNTGAILDLAPSFLETGYVFSDFGRYVMLAEDKYLRAFLVFRKELEGESWKNVDIVPVKPKDITFDGILYRCMDEKDIPTSLSLNSSLEDISVNAGATFVISFDFHIDEFLFSDKWLDLPCGFHLESAFQVNYIPHLVYKSGLLQKDSICFAAPDVNSNLLINGSIKRDQIVDELNDILQYYRDKDDYFVIVQKEDLRDGILSPSFYIKRKEIIEPGTISLYDICNFDAITTKQDLRLDNVLLAPRFDYNPSLSEITPERVSWFYFDYGYVLTQNAILILLNTDSAIPRNCIVSRIKVEPGSEVFVLRDRIIPLVVDPNRYDPRFVMISIQKANTAGYESLIGFPAVLDLIRIPDIPLEEQRKAVEAYLEGVKETLPGYVRDPGSKPVTYNILVITPDRETFEGRFGGKMVEEHLNVVGYASDSKSLSEVLPKHFGKDVPASQRVDAVLADVSAPVGDTNFVLMKIHDLDVRKFYYSTCGYSRGCIYDIFWDAVESGLVEGDEPASGMRRALDTQMSPEARLREEYREFFRSADRLDSLHPGWDLSGAVMKFLLDGRTKTPVNTVRSLLSETLCRFFRDCRAVPFCMEDGAIPSFLADGSYYDGKRRLEFKAAGKVDDKRQKSEAWVRYAFVALFKLGNKESHDSKETEEMVSEAALIILMQVIRWFEGVHDRYAEGGVGFKCFRGSKECRLQTVREVAPGYFAVGDVHVGNQEGLCDGSVGVLNDLLPPEKDPRTIDGTTFTRYAGKDSFHILLQ